MREACAICSIISVGVPAKRWVTCRPGFFLPVRVLSRLFRRLFLERLLAAYQANRLKFFGCHVALADPRAFAAYLAPLRRAECRVGGDVAAPTPGHRRRSPASGSHRT